MQKAKSISFSNRKSPNVPLGDSISHSFSRDSSLKNILTKVTPVSQMRSLHSTTKTSNSSSPFSRDSKLFYSKRAQNYFRALTSVGIKTKIPQYPFTHVSQMQRFWDIESIQEYDVKSELETRIHDTLIQKRISKFKPMKFTRSHKSLQKSPTRQSSGKQLSTSKAPSNDATSITSPIHAQNCNEIPLGVEIHSKAFSIHKDTTALKKYAHDWNEVSIEKGKKVNDIGLGMNIHRKKPAKYKIDFMKYEDKMVQSPLINRLDKKSNRFESILEEKEEVDEKGKISLAKVKKPESDFSKPIDIKRERQLELQRKTMAYAYIDQTPTKMGIKHANVVELATIEEETEKVQQIEDIQQSKRPSIEKNVIQPSNIQLEDNEIRAERRMVFENDLHQVPNEAQFHLHEDITKWNANRDSSLHGNNEPNPNEFLFEKNSLTMRKDAQWILIREEDAEEPKTPRPSKKKKEPSSFTKFHSPQDSKGVFSSPSLPNLSPSSSFQTSTTTPSPYVLQGSSFVMQPTSVSPESWIQRVSRQLKNVFS